MQCFMHYLFTIFFHQSLMTEVSRTHYYPEVVNEMLIHLSGKNVNVTEKKDQDISKYINCTKNLDFLGILPIFLIRLFMHAKLKMTIPKLLLIARDRGGLWKINIPKVK